MSSPEKQYKFLDRNQENTQSFSEKDIRIKSEELLFDALSLAKEQHQGQKYAGVDFFERHVLPVVKIACEYAKKHEYNRYKISILAALHDVGEKGNIRIEDIKTPFGKRIAKGVKNLSRERPSEGINTNGSEKYFNASFENRGDILVKAADRIHNLKNLKTLPNDKKTRKISEYIMEHRFFDKLNNEFLPTEVLDRLTCLIRKAIYDYKSYIKDENVFNMADKIR